LPVSAGTAYLPVLIALLFPDPVTVLMGLADESLGGPVALVVVSRPKREQVDGHDSRPGLRAASAEGNDGTGDHHACEDRQGGDEEQQGRRTCELQILAMVRAARQACATRISMAAEAAVGEPEIDVGLEIGPD
jgi:hypothetical protein